MSDDRYQSAPHPPKHAGMGLGDYLEQLQRRALSGDHEAQTELDRWERMLSKKPGGTI